MAHNNGLKLVLIADDNADAGDTLGCFLETLGLRVVVVRDGEEAVKAAATEMPDVAILDLGMPKLDGWTVCQELRRLPGGSDARIIALSGWGAPDAREKSARSGFDAHWTKPAEATELLRVVLTVQQVLPPAVCCRALEHPHGRRRPAYALLRSVDHKTVIFGGLGGFIRVLPSVQIGKSVRRPIHQTFSLRNSASRQTRREALVREKTKSRTKRSDVSSRTPAALL